MTVMRTSNGGVKTNQRGYIEATLREFSFEICKPVSTPIEPHKRLDLTSTDSPRCDSRKYQQLGGRLLWIAMVTWLNITFIVGRLSQYNADPTQDHWVA